MEPVYRLLSQHSENELGELIEHIEQNMENEEWWVPISEHEAFHFFDRYRVVLMGAFHEKQLIGASALYLPNNGLDKMNEVLDACKVPRENTGFIERCMVREEYRGNKIMFKMNRMLLGEAKEHEIKRIVSTVHPDNVASRRSIERTGMKKEGEITIGDKYLRYIYKMDIDW